MFVGKAVVNASQVLGCSRSVRICRESESIDYGFVADCSAIGSHANQYEVRLGPCPLRLGLSVSLPSSLAPKGASDLLRSGRSV